MAVSRSVLLPLAVVLVGLFGLVSSAKLNLCQLTSLAYTPTSQVKTLACSARDQFKKDAGGNIDVAYPPGSIMLPVPNPTKFDHFQLSMFALKTTLDRQYYEKAAAYEVLLNAEGTRHYTTPFASLGNNMTDVETKVATMLAEVTGFCYNCTINVDPVTFPKAKSTYTDLAYYYGDMALFNYGLLNAGCLLLEELRVALQTSLSDYCVTSG
eukprot:scpid84932/ scgid33551/ 